MESAVDTHRRRDDSGKHQDGLQIRMGPSPSSIYISVLMVEVAHDLA